MMADPVRAELGILFADICDSVGTFDRQGNTRAQVRVSTSLHSMAAVVEARGGTVFRSFGDEILAHFPDADMALQAARDIQNNPLTDQTAIKCGIGFGTVIFDDGEMYGQAVNLSSRMMSWAKAGEIITWSDCISALTPALARSCSKMTTTSIKGSADPIEIWSCGAGLNPATVTMHHDVSPGPKESRLVLHSSSETQIFTARDVPFSIGRDPSCRLVLAKKHVSRFHLKVGFFRGNFRLEDTSSNGTYVRAFDADCIKILREHFILHGTGQIGLGDDPARDDVTRLDYELIA